MKVVIKDKPILKTIEPQVLANHLQGQGWHLERNFNENSNLWLKDLGEESVEILLPLRDDLVDYAARISDAIQILEVVEQRSQLEILADLPTTAKNLTIQGIVTHLNENLPQGTVTLMGVVLGKLHPIQLELSEPNYKLALQAYASRLPILCQGDLTKQGTIFWLENLQEFTLELEANTSLLADKRLDNSGSSDYLANLEDYEKRLVRGEIQW
jgi:hypothetical protein